MFYKSVDKHCQVYMHILQAHPGGSALRDTCTDNRDKIGTKPDSTHRRGKENSCGPRLTSTNKNDETLAKNIRNWTEQCSLSRDRKFTQANRGT